MQARGQCFVIIWVMCLCSFLSLLRILLPLHLRGRFVIKFFNYFGWCILVPWTRFYNIKSYCTDYIVLRLLISESCYSSYIRLEFYLCYHYILILFLSWLIWVQDKNEVQHQISILLFVGLTCGVFMFFFTRLWGEWALTGNNDSLINCWLVESCFFFHFQILNSDLFIYFKCRLASFYWCEECGNNIFSKHICSGTF